MIERLAQGGRDKLKEDGLNFSDWLQSLASFWGSLYVSYFFIYPHEFDIHPQGELEFQCTCAKQNLIWKSLEKKEMFFSCL